MVNMKEKLKNKIIKVYFNYKLKKVGNVELRYGRLICNVDMNKVNKHFSTPKETVLRLENDSYKRTLRKFGFYGKIVYLFKGATIYGNFKIISPFSGIRFKDCTFSNSVEVVSADEVAFNGDIILKNYYAEKKVSLSGKTKKLSICDAKIGSPDSVPVSFNFESDSVFIVDSSLNLEDGSELNIVSNELSLGGSKLNVGQLDLNLRYLTSCNSKVVVNKCANINLKNVTDIDFIKAKRLTLNGEQFIDAEEVLEVDKARLDLVTVLKEISLECKNRKLEETETIGKANQMTKKM